MHMNRYEEEGQEDGDVEHDWPLDREACIALVEAGGSASSLLDEADRNFSRRFNRLDTAIVKLLADVRKHFPDATYYTASGGFNLLLGSSHTGHGESQHDLIALSGKARISDGDF